MTTPAVRGRPARRAERARLTRERKHARRLRRELDSGRADRDPALLPGLHRRGTEVAVPPELRRGTVVGAGWPGDCEQGAYAYLTRHAHVPGVRLAHGYATEAGLVWPHAWVEIGDETVYDPSLGRFFELPSFYGVLQAVPLVVYTASQALERAEATGTPGPWPECHALHASAMQARLEELLGDEPELAAWLDAMRSAEPAFAARIEKAKRTNQVLTVHVVEHLAATGRWREHNPGGGWQGELHPLGLV